MRFWSAVLAIGALCLTILSASQAQEPTLDFLTESMPSQKFEGKIEDSAQKSQSYWPALHQLPFHDAVFADTRGADYRT